MADNRKFEQGHGYQVSALELDQLRRKWADVGTEVWNAATRAGQDIKARTRAELEALGRARLNEARIQQAQSDAVRDAVSTVAKAANGAARHGLAAATQSARDFAGVQATATDVRQRQSVAAANRGLDALAGTTSDPAPARLVTEWMTGQGPERRVLGPETRFSKEFVEAPSVREEIDSALSGWRRRPGGVQGNYTDHPGVFRYPNDPWRDGFNGASQVVGSFALSGKRDGANIDWKAGPNRMSLRSFFYGRKLDDLGLPSVPETRRPGPFGTTEQTVEFRTDLDGRPLRARP